MYLGRRGRTGGPPSEVWSTTCEDGWASGMGWLAALPPPPLLLLLLLLLPPLPSSFLSFFLFFDRPGQGAGAEGGGVGTATVRSERRTNEGASGVSSGVEG